ncbi:hypothetical protein FE810_08080 [Thalassotalea litorea]|uniref:Translocation and assembly module TamB C-terminal domain-containing protein n=1 Tax=Thalassotalea litorea TaxID=2020715 RepID=A0A5R9II84_9GAMM|nr:translocation/assembly module TamB domain-containing protein [Thalassotalea litorea]TLU65244.1 hypothetical protein FE810_08080 [Thalassotalea litorea]
MKLKSIGKWLLSFVLTMLVLLPLLIFTQMGNRLIIAGLNLLPFLKMDFEQGHILSDASFKRIELDFTVIIIRIDDLNYSLQARCLANSKLCITAMQASGVYIDMPDIDDDEQEKQDADNQLIVLPIDLRIENVEVTQFIFKQSAIAIQASEFSANLHASDSHVTVSDGQLAHLDVTLLDDAHSKASEDKDSKPGNTEPNTETNTKPKVNDKVSKSANESTWALAQLPDVFIPIDLQLLEFNLENFALKLAPDPEKIAPIHTSKLTLAARWSGFLLDVERFELASKDYGRADINGHMDWQYPWGTEFILNTEIDKFPWYEPLQGSKQRVNVSGDFSQLSVQLTSDGPIKLTADVQTDLVDSKLPFVANVQSPKLDLQPLVAQPLVVKKVQSQISGDLQSQQVNAQLVLQGFGYQQGALTLTGIHRKQALNLSSFRFHDTPSDSVISGQLDLDYGAELIVKLDANLPGFQLPEVTVGTVPIQGRVKGQVHLFTKLDTNQLPKSLEQPGKWQLSSYNTNLEGIVNEQPAAVAANFSIDQDLAVKDAMLQVRFQDSLLNLEGYSDENWHVNGTLQGAEFHRWHPMLQGQLNGDIRIRGELMVPNLVVDASVQNVQYQNIRVPDADIDISYWPSRSHKAQVSIGSESVNIGKYQASGIAALLQGDLSRQQLTLDSQGDFPVHLVVENQLDLEQLTSQLDIQEAHLRYLEHLWALEKGFSSTVDINQQLVTLSPHCWQQGDNEICVTQPGKLANDGDIALGWHLQLGDYDHFLLGKKVKVDSRISGKANVSWQALKMNQLQLENTIEKGSLTLIGDEQQSTLLTWTQGHINAQADESQATLDLFLNRDDDTQLIAGDARIDLGQDTLPMQGNLDIERFQIHLIEELVPGMSRARGDFSAAIDFSGSVTAPILSGTMSLHDGELATYQSPNTIDHIDVDMVFKGQSADVEGGFLIKDHPGEITANLDWRDGFNANARLFAEKLPILFPPSLDALVSTDIHLDLEGQLAKISGEISVLDGLLKLEDLPEGSVELSDDAVIVDASGKQVKKEKTFAVTSDVDLAINPKFRLKGQGFKGNLGGKLKIRQEKFQPVQLFGVLKIANGNYKAYGQDLDVKSGEITFVGSPSNPTINVKAVREIKDESVTAGLSIIGPTDALSLTFFSNPSMPQPEILSYITRGRGLDSNSGGGAAVGVALASALTKTTPLQNVVQKLPLLTDVSLDAEVEGDITQATISGYLGERIFLKYGVGVYEPINELTVRLYLMSRLWLETVSGLENSADIYYSFEID